MSFANTLKYVFKATSEHKGFAGGVRKHCLLQPSQGYRSLKRKRGSF